ncbi:hypothetical protein B7P43_G09923 [Cryptotermes secundus]|uniref:peptidylamidoglycolate lyase n=1 Tax=Cryptotermes secundus TaxID=105785 RepID=A0A2J7QPM1_9NEOP|nr:hypothetical protein B7P43_G09923 [Cryptotermes secundus]
MAHYVLLVLAFTLSSSEFSSTGFEHDIKRHVWSRGEDTVGTFNSAIKPAGMEPPDYGNQTWTSEGFSVIASWPDSTKKLGQLSAVSLDVDGNIVIFHRGDRVWDGNTFLTNNVYNQRAMGPISQPTVVVFNASSGLVVEEWGRSIFYLPHGLTVDADNNVWVTDVALHQVFKFSQGGGKPLLTLGVAFMPGNDDDHFCKPSAVAVMSNGDFFVSDGYCNTRIIKFDKNGKFLIQWGRNSFQGIRSPVYEFSVPHALTLAEDKEMLCVADRENGRVQCFNCHNGSFIVQFRSREMGSRIFSVAYSPAQGGLLTVVNGPEFGGGGLVSGFVISLARKQLIEAFSPNGQGFHNPHDVAISTDGNQIYVVELDPYKVWKFVKGSVNSTRIEPRPIANTSTSAIKSVIPQNGLNFSRVQIVELPVNSSSASTIAAMVGIISIAAVIAVVIFAAVMKIRKRGPNSQLRRWDFPISQMGGFNLDRHQGFEKVSTEESDEEGASSTVNFRQLPSPFA